MRHDDPMTPEPPDWLLPAWDAAPSERDDPPRRPAVAPPGTFGLRVRTVSEVSRTIRDRVRGDDGLRDLWVEGEVGRVTVSTAGHAYFTLKDARGQPLFPVQGPPRAAPVLRVPRRPRALAVPAPDGTPGRGARPDGPVRAT